jgi:hypothetical protein
LDLLVRKEKQALEELQDLLEQQAHLELEQLVQLVLV